MSETQTLLLILALCFGPHVLVVLMLCLMDPSEALDGNGE